MMPSESVHCVVTSPPYWGLRDYGVAGQIGLEASLGEHIDMLVRVFHEVRRVLRKDGTLWLNYGDAYASAPNGRSAADTKAAGNDDRTFRDKPISTVGPILIRRKGDDTRGANSKEGFRPGHSERIAAGGVLKPKDRMLLPARVAIALQEDGWWVRDEIIWHKPNPMPSSVKDRTTPAHEMIYLLTKSARYSFDTSAIKEPCTSDERRPTFRGGAYVNNSTFDNAQGGKSTVVGNIKRGKNETSGDRTKEGFNTRYKKTKVPGGWDKGEGAHGTVHRDGRTAAEYVEMEVSAFRNKRSVWTVAPSPFPDAHFATFPPALIEPCILAGCPVGGTVLDPFFGAGTTGLVAAKHGRNCIGIELNADYVAIATKRLGLGVFG